MDSNEFAAFAQQQTQMLSQEQQTNQGQAQNGDSNHETSQQQTQASDAQQQSQPQQQQQQQQQQQLQQFAVRPDQQFLGGMNVGNLANFTQGFQMMQQQPGQFGAGAPFSNMPVALMGPSPLQQQLSALSGLTGQMQNQDGSGAFNASGFQGLQPAGLQALQQMGFHPAMQQAQQQQPQQASFFPNGFNPQFMQAAQAPQQIQQPAQQQQQQQQVASAPNSMMTAAPNVGLNLQQLQQLMTQQLFAQHPAAVPAGFNLSALTGIAPGGMQGVVPGTMVAPALLPQQLASLAGVFGAQHVQMQQPTAQQMFTNGLSGLTVPGLSIPGMPGAKQDNDITGDVKSVVEGEWAEPFAGKGKKEPPFPLKLHQILSNPEFSECICWNTHGRSWRILKPPVFEQVVIPLYFRHAKYASFMRQVNGWGFKRIVSGNDHNSYYHEMFVREFPQLCLKMKRIRKGEAEKARKDGDSKNSDKDDDSKDDGSGKDDEEIPTSSAQASAYNATQNTLQNLQAGSMLGQAAAVQPNGNDAALNFLKASGLAGFMGNQQLPNMNALNGQNFLQGLIMAGGGANSFPGLNFGQQDTSGIANFANGGQVAAPAPQSQPVNTSSSSPASMNQIAQAMQSTPGGAQLGNGAAAPAPSPFAAFSGVDSAAIAKLQEALAAAGGAGMFAQQQNSQQTTGVAPATVSSNVGGNSNETDAANAANNAFASLFGGQNASLLAAQIQAATQQQQQQQQQQARLKNEEDGDADV